MAKEWNLSFEGYLVLDGWGHIRVGQTLASHGLAFCSPVPLARSKQRSISAITKPDFSYDVIANVVFKSTDACVIDFGLFAVGSSDRLPDEAKTGDYVLGNIRLGVDRSYALPEDFEKFVPRYKWFVQGITADLTPHIPSPEDSSMLVRDENNVRYEKTPSTVLNNLTIPLVPMGEFILHCRLVDFDQASE